MITWKFYHVRNVLLWWTRWYWLTHWGLVMHICVSKLTIIASDNGLSPGRRQTIIWTNAGILLIGPLGTNFNEIFIEIQTFSFKKVHLKMSSGKCCPLCLGLNVLIFTSEGTIVCYWLSCILKSQHYHEPIMHNTASNSQQWLAIMCYDEGTLTLVYLTHWGRDKMDAISQTTFSNAFSWMKMFQYRLKFHWSLFLRVK